MITDEYVKQLFHKSWSNLSKQMGSNEPQDSQIHRGCMPEDPHPGGCDQHLLAFKEYNIIPRHCFGCYKVLIEPQSVVELFKLMVVFGVIELPSDNRRKCMVEIREQVSGAYKGYIFCRSVEEGEEIIKMIQKVISKEISENIPITLKRGCSEYALAYPEYTQIDETAETMKYKEEWQEYEDLTDEKFGINTQFSDGTTLRHPEYTLRDVGAMFVWLNYAAAIGDLSYLRISGSALNPPESLKRTSSFSPIGR